MVSIVLGFFAVTMRVNRNIFLLFAGIDPMVAARAHQQSIQPVFEKALRDSNLEMSDISCVAVAAGPGLQNCLTVGLNFAKQLCQKYNKPLVAINHLEAHSAVLRTRGSHAMRRSCEAGAVTIGGVLGCQASLQRTCCTRT